MTEILLKGRKTLTHPSILKESLGVAGHSKNFCIPKMIFAPSLSEILLSYAFSLISITSTKIYVYCQNDAKSVRGFNAFFRSKPNFSMKESVTQEENHKYLICMES